MDGTDEKIISILRKNSRMPFVRIAEKTGLTEGAIRVRVKKLLSESVIRKFTVDTSNESRGVVLISTSSGVPTTTVAGKIRELGVDGVYETSGSYDIICFVPATSVKDVNVIVEKIRKIRGVKSTNTCMVLK